MNNKILILVVVIIIAGAVYFSAREKNETANSIKDAEEITMVEKEFSMTARRFAFEPDNIRVKKGDAVKLKITSVDVTHGFSISEFGVNAELKPSQTTIVEFVASKSGTFTFSCSVVCGAGHPDMKGTLVVE